MVSNLKDLLVEELKDLYHAEKQIVKALPKMAKKASNPQLQRAFEEHLEVTQKQVERLEQVFEELGMKPKTKVCHAMEGIIEEGKEVMQEDMTEDVLDAALIGAAQKVEHYEIAGYGTARTFAEQLGLSKAAKLLQQTLDEEGETDKKLSQLAISRVNPQAQDGEDGDDEV